MMGNQSKVPFNLHIAYQMTSHVDIKQQEQVAGRPYRLSSLIYSPEGPAIVVPKAPAVPKSGEPSAFHFTGSAAVYLSPAQFPWLSEAAW